MAVWAKANLYIDGKAAQLLPSMQYVTGKHRVSTFLVRVKGCKRYFVFAFVRADMTSPSEDRDLFMLYSLIPKKKVKVGNRDSVHKSYHCARTLRSQRMNTYLILLHDTAFTCASLSCSPVAPLFPARSLPARSTYRMRPSVVHYRLVGG